MNLIYRLAKQKDLNEIMALMEKTSNAIEDKDLFVADDRHFIGRHIGGEGEIVLAKAEKDSKEGVLAGFLVLRFPMNAEDNLGRDLGWDKKACLKVVHMESVVVDRDFRGHKIMQKLVEQGEHLAQERGFLYGLCTVSPDNPWSLSNMLATGYVIMKTCPKYGGKIRHILCHRLNDNEW